MLILVGAIATFFCFAFLYKCTPPMFVKALLLYFGTFGPVAAEEELHAELERRWRTVILVVATIVFMVGLFAWLITIPPDPEDPCSWRACP